MASLRLSDLDADTRRALQRRMRELAPARARELLQELRPTPVAQLRVTRLGGSPSVWTVELEIPPRSKKNHTAWLGVQGKPYRRFAAGVKSAIAPLLLDPQFALPIPRAIALRMSATLYVDRYGKAADVFGLLQAAADALQDAGFFENDHQVRGLGSVDIVIDDPRPRLALTFIRMTGDTTSGLHDD